MSPGSSYMAKLALACSAGFPLGAPAETIVSLYSGTSSTRASDLHLEQPSSASDVRFHDVHWQAHTFQDAPYYGLRLTHYSSEQARLGVAFDLTHYKAHADTSRNTRVQGTWNGAPVDESAPMNLRVRKFEISHGANFASLNLLYRWSMQSSGAFPAGRVRPYLGGGVGGYFPHVEGTVNGQGVAWSYQPAGLGLQLLGGIEFALNRRVRLFAEARIDRGSLSVSNEGSGSAATHLTTGHLLAGVSCGF